jgi:hypothetical protein
VAWCAAAFLTVTAESESPTRSTAPESKRTGDGQASNTANFRLEDPPFNASISLPVEAFAMSLPPMKCPLAIGGKAKLMSSAWIKL